MPGPRKVYHQKDPGLMILCPSRSRFESLSGGGSLSSCELQARNSFASKIACLAIVGLVCHSSGVSRMEIDCGIDLTSLPEVFLGLLVSFQIEICPAGEITRLAIVLLLCFSLSPDRLNLCHILPWVPAAALPARNASEFVAF